MKKIVDMDKWNEFCEAKIKQAKSYASFWDGVAANMQMTKEWMDNQPDAEEKRGKWRKSGYEEWVCSCCNYLCIGSEDYAPNDFMMHYCPNCGAKMDLTEEE